MSYLKCSLTSIVAVLWLLSSTAAAQQELAWKLAAGQEFDVLIEQTGTNVTQVESREVVVNTSVRVGFLWQVEEVSDEQVELTQSLASIEVAVGDPAVPDQAIEYATNSTEKFSSASRKLLKQVQPLIGLEFAVSMKPNGEIIKIELTDDARKVIQQLPDALRIKQLFQPEGIEGLLGGAAMKLPESAVAGAQWTEAETIGSPLGQLQRIHEYEIGKSETREDQDWTRIRLVTKLEGPTDPPQEGQPKLISFDGSGEFDFNQSGGYLANGSVTSTLVSEKPYREKTIISRVENQMKLTIQPR